VWPIDARLVLAEHKRYLSLALLDLAPVS